MSFGSRNRRKSKKSPGAAPFLQRAAGRLGLGRLFDRGRDARVRRMRSVDVPDDPLAPRGLDLWLLFAALSLVGLGLTMVYSSSSVFAAVKLHDAAFYLRRHFLYGSLGLFALYIGYKIDYRQYLPWIYPMLLGIFLLLAALLVPGIGRKVDGAVRWFRLGPLSFQPSELAKLVLVMYLAYSLAKKKEEMRLFSIGFLPHLVVASVMGILVLRQPDLGTTAILMAVTLLMLFVAGTKISYILMALLAAAPIVYHQIVGTPWRLRRMIAFFDPWAHRRDMGYQVAESLISVGSGGIHGLGLGSGKQKLFFLPAAHTDFIFAITGEELGLIGLLGVILLFGLLVVRGLRASFGAADLFGAYLAFGITATLGLQALLHMAVVLGLVPTKGITLPLFSYGGSGLLVNMFSVGVLLNIAARNPAPMVKRIAVSKKAKDNRKRTQRVAVRTEEAM
jgi:cell division protein FtsW